MECWIYHVSIVLTACQLPEVYKVWCYLSFKAVGRKHVEDLTRHFG